MAAQMQPTNPASKAVAMTRINRRSLSILVLSPFSACVDYPTRPFHLIAGFTPGHSGAIILFVALHPPLKPPGKARMIVATSTRAAHSPRNALLRARSHRKNYAAQQ